MNKKNLCAVVAAMSLFLAASSALADDIKGRVGLTGMIGFLVPADSELSGRVVRTGTGFIGGGGVIYGITKNIAAELDITHTDYDADAGLNNSGTAETNNISLGVQYRFSDPVEKLSPFVGTGLDILVNDFTFSDGRTANVDTMVGVHLSGGADYFVMKQLALTSQLKFVLAPDSDITYQGTRIGKFDPMSFSMLFGARYFFR